MKNLKVKIGKTEFEAPLSLLVGLIVFIVCLYLIVFGYFELGDLYKLALKIWRDVKR